MRLLTVLKFPPSVLRPKCRRMSETVSDLPGLVGSILGRLDAVLEHPQGAGQLKASLLSVPLLLALELGLQVPQELRHGVVPHLGDRLGEVLKRTAETLNRRGVGHGFLRAEDGTRTRNFDLGKVALYH